ncbi:hypothetical protein [Marinicella meishanensis]|uniref:hypothetical protein n=1 Tax=Marinicella meishanensis TaxID=2873263 RepID=UPI001CBC77CE|nr:hypothetical protein [Marinicella sp. NBU2979]
MRTIGLFVMVLWGAVSQADVFAYDFEEAEGFVAGMSLQQNQWTLFDEDDEQPAVSDEMPSSGALHGSIKKDLTIPFGAFSGVLSPNFGVQPSDRQPTASMDLSISDLDGAAYDVIGQSVSQNLITWRVRFTNSGDIQVYDSPGGSNGFVDTDADYPVGSYFNLRVTADTINNQLTYYVDDTLIYTAAAGVAFGQSLEQIVFVCNNAQAAPNESFLFDNLIINTLGPDLIFKTGFEQPK